MASLEVLPNEILIQCFQYLNAFTLFHAFNQLNARFNHLIRQMSLCINFEDIPKCLFDEFCMILSQDETTKNQVYSLHLSDEDRCLQSKEFWSRFSCEDFPRLQIFKSNIFLKPYQEDLRKTLISLLNRNLQACLNLQKLSIFHLNLFISNSVSNLPLTHVTLSECESNDFLNLLKIFPVLKYLHINKLHYHYTPDPNKFLDSQHHLHLTELMIDNFKSSFETLELFVKQTLNLQSLTICCFFFWMTFVAERWERLITQSLPDLNHFKFVGSAFIDQNSAENILEQYRSHFWREHHWFVEMIFGEGFAIIYTIPYVSKTFIGPLNGTKMNQKNEDQINALTHITHVTACEEIPTETCEYYFPNLRILDIAYREHQPYSKQQIENFNKRFNFSRLKHLNIWNYSRTEISIPLLVNILRASPQLSSMSIHWNSFTSLFMNNELCGHFNQLIRTLCVEDDEHRRSLDQSFDVQKFCQVFSNLKHLQCNRGHAKRFLSIFNRLSSLLTLKLDWVDEENPKDDLDRFKDEVEKLNAAHNIGQECRNHSIPFHTSKQTSSSVSQYFVNIDVWF